MFFRWRTGLKKLRLLLTLAGILILGSCEIGLGSAVDTDAPSLSIETGIADKVIRDDFALRGKYSDDGSIESLSAVLKRTDGEGSALTFSGELTEDEKNRGSGTWKISIPAKTRPITDGTYQADVTIKDGVGRVTVQSTIFTIDNTAPVIVLTRPSTAAEAENPDTYGQKFTIEGQAADTNNISRIEIRLYEDKECTKPAGEEPIVLKNVPLSIAMDAASYDGSEENYIYEGETKDFAINVAKDGKGKPFYCKIYAYDGSSRYLEEGETASAEDEKGNCAEYYYLYKEIYTPVLQYYKITDLYSILNGTYKEEGARTVSAEGVKNALFTDEKYHKKTGSFILNPKNNPTFTVTGKSPLNLDGHDFEGSSNANDILNGQSVFIEVSPGLDDIPLEVESLKVYAIECDANGKAVTGAKKIYPETEREEKGSSYRFTVKIVRSEEGEEGLKIGKTYLFGVDGYDQSEAKNLIEPSGKAFGFRMAANGNAPVLTLDTPSAATTYIKKGLGQTFKGYVEVEMGAPEVLIYRETENDENPYKIEFNESQAVKVANGLHYDFTYSYDDFGSENGIYKFIFRAGQAGLYSQPVEKTIVYDVAAPEISVLNITPNIEDTLKDDGTETGGTIEGSYLNMTAGFTVAIADEYDSVKEASYQITVDGNEESPVMIENPTRCVFNIDTTRYVGKNDRTTQKTLKLVLRAKDRAGNETKDTENTYIYTIDQSTDIPVILPGSSDSVTFTLADRNAFANQSGDKKNIATVGSSMLFKLRDDDGLKQITVKNTSKNLDIWTETDGWVDLSRAKDDQNITSSTQNLEHRVSGTSASFSYPLPSEGGLYKFHVEAEDKYGEKTVKEFVLKMTKAAVEISSVTQKDSKNAANGTGSAKLTNIISIVESQSPYKLYRNNVLIKENITSFPYEDEINVSELTEGENRISYCIEDGNERKSGTVETVLVRDDTAPTVSLKALPFLTEMKSFDSYTFQGTAADSAAGSGIKASGIDRVVLTVTGSVAAGGTTSYEINPNGENWVNLVEWDKLFKRADGTKNEGTKTVRVKAYDKAGNESTSFTFGNGSSAQSGKTEVSFIYDVTEPELSTPVLSGIKDGKYILSGAKISGTATDSCELAQTDVLIVTEFLEGTVTPQSGRELTIDAEHNWEVAIPLNQSNPSDGSYTYRFTLADKAGNRNISNDIKLMLDTTAPSSELSGLPGRQDTKNRGYTFTGTADDGNTGSGVKEVKLTITDVQNPLKTKTVTVDGTSRWSYPLDCTDTQKNGTECSWAEVFENEGEKIVYISASDNAGLSGTTFTYSKDNPKTGHAQSGTTALTFKYDTADPILTVRESEFREYMSDSGFTVSGTAQDSYPDGELTLTVTEKFIGTETASSGETVTIGSDDSWTKLLPLGGVTPSEGKYTYQFILKDHIGNIVRSEELNTTVDKTAPKVKITTPSADSGEGSKKGKNAVNETSFKFEGEYTEGENNEKSRISGIYAIIKTGTEGPALPAEGDVLDSAKWIEKGFTQVSIDTGSWYFYQSFNSGTEAESGKKPEGTDYKLYIYAVDKAGNTGHVDASDNEAKRIFDVDLENPSVNLTSKEEKVYNAKNLNDQNKGSFSISGAVTETHSAASVKVEAKSASVTKTFTISSLTRGTETETKNLWNWEQAFVFGSGYEAAPPANYLEDGVYTVTVSAADGVGKESGKDSVKITVDTKAPVINADGMKLNDEAYSADSWYGAKTLSITNLSVSDGSGSGILSVQTASKKKDGSISSWKPLSLVDGFYTGTVQLDEDGSKEFYIKATDIAGNDPAEQTFSVKIDTSEPELEDFKYKIGTNGSLESVSGTVFINKQDTLIVYGSYSDSQSGVRNLEFTGASGQPVITYSKKTVAASSDSDYKAFSTYTGEEDTTNQILSWKAVFSNGAGGIIQTGNYTVTGRNNAGAEGLSTGSKKLFLLNLDDTKPTLKNLSLSTTSEKYSVYPQKKERNKTDAEGNAIEDEDGNPVKEEYIEKYFVNNTNTASEPQTFIISGLAEDKSGEEGDASGIKSVVLKLGNSEPVISNSAYFANLDLSGFTGSVTAEITVTDNAGNSYSENLPEIVFDTTGPKGIHVLDDSTDKVKKDSDGNPLPTPKDLYFRIGDQGRDDFVTKDSVTDEPVYNDNGDAVVVTGSPSWIHAKDTDVGGKYSGNTFGNTETVKIRGAFEDKVSSAEDAAEGSGVSIIYYKLYTTEPDNSMVSGSPDTEDFLKNYQLLADGYFSPLKNAETKRVFYTDKGIGDDAGKLHGTFTPVNGGSYNGKYYTDITSTFKTTIPGLEEGSNYLVLVAVDKVGNAALESVIYNGKTFSNYRINVDKKQPLITAQNQAKGLYTNAEDKLDILGTVVDYPVDNDPDDDEQKNAGIKSVFLKYDDIKEHWIKATITGDTWTASISQDKLLELYDEANPTITFTATATDNSGSGNTYSCDVNVTIDKTAPVVEITGPRGAGENSDGITQVNGQITVKGTATDETGLSSSEPLKLYYRKKTNSDTQTPQNVTSLTGWGVYTATTVNTSGEWSIETTGSGTIFDDDTVYYFTVAAEDKAGNPGYAKPLALEVSKDSDRPVVKFYMTFSSSITSSTSELDGVISDDDGTPSKDKVWYAVTEENPDTNTPVLPQSSDWKKTDAEGSVFSYKTDGSFSISPGDGTKYIWFKIDDGKNTTAFESSSSATYSFSTPKVSDKDGSTVYGLKSNATATYLKVKTDTTAPLTSSFAYLAKGCNPAAEATQENPDGWSTNTGSALFGGTESNTFRVMIYAYDENGISSVKFKIPMNDNDPQQIKDCAVQDSIDSSKKYYEYSLSKKTEINGIQKEKTINGKKYSLYWLTGNTDVVDVTGFASGARACIIDTYDGTKHSTETYSFSIDNTPAEATFTSHSDNDQIRAAFMLKGGFNDGDNKTTLKYKLLTSATEPSDWSDATEVLNVGSNSWNISFDGKTDTQSTHDELPKQVVASLLSSTVEIAASGENQGKAVYKVDVTEADGTVHTAGELYKTITPVYFHMKASDAIGNSSWSKLVLKLDPQGDIPTIKMSYPVIADNAETLDGTQLKYTKLSGIIRAQGSAEDDKNIVGIYMQIDPDFNGTFADNWNTKNCPNGKTLSESGYTVEDMYTSYNEKKPAGAPEKTDGPVGVRIGSSPSWNKALNASGEFNKTNEINYIAIRLYAVDEDGNISIWDEKDLFVISIDSDAPKFGSSEPFYLYQYGFKEKSSNQVYYAKTKEPSDQAQLYTDPGCHTEADGQKYSESAYDSAIVSMQYTNNMWLNGEWWLRGSVEDENDITELKVKLGNGEYGDNLATDNPADKKTWGSGTAETKGYILNCLIGSTETSVGYGTLSYTVSATDGADGDNQKTDTYDITVRYDNKVPTLASSSDDDYSISKDVVNDNGFYKVQSVVTEAADESGFDKVLFYFKRGETVYDSYLAKTDSPITSGLVSDSNIYWKSIEVTEVSGDTITVSADSNIHKGGLVRVGGVIYTITDVSGTEVRLNGNPASSVKNTNALFAIGHVVDHAGTESEGTKANKVNGYYTDSPDDDGDRMLEKVSTGSTKTLWYGMINSRNIPDGSIEIHYVAFDKAGNMAHGVVENAFVKNNGPRLAGLRVWTDYNGDEHEDPDESKVSYYNEKQRKIGKNYEGRATDVTEKLVVSGNGSDWTETGDKAATAFMRVTDTTKFYPEIVGGNGNLYYSYRIGTGSDPDSWTTATGNSKTKEFSSGTGIEYSDNKADYMTNDDQANPESYVNGSASDAITADITLLGTVGNGNKWFEYTIWDSTEEKTPFDASGTQVATTLSAKFAVLLNVDYADETPPTAVISPFFWNNLNSNSIYGSAEKDVNDNYKVSSVHDLAGHIELESDLTGTQAETAYGSDPKVSGKITIRGTAYDNIRLKQLWVKFDDITMDVAADNDISGTNPDSSRSDYVLAAVYSKNDAGKAVWKAASASMDSQSWSFSATDDYCNKDGHLVNWELSVDTSKVSDVAALDKSVHIMAVAARGTGTNGYSPVTADTIPATVTDYSTAAETYNKPSYQMDIVPYVSEVVTSLSTYNSAGKKGVYDRTALGHYPVYKTHAQGDGGYSYETVTIKGFNLWNGIAAGENGSVIGNIVFDIHEPTTGTELALLEDTTTENRSYTNTASLVPVTGQAGTYTFELPNGAKSGNAHIEVGSGTNAIKSLNNANKNDAKGSYTGATEWLI